MPISRFFAVTTVATLALALGGGLTPAFAQSTGNPKGSAAPPSSDASKAGATSGPSTANGDSSTGRLTAEKGQADARVSTSKSPGTGTAGGLPKRTPADGADASRAGPASSSQPTRQPAAPAK